MTTSCTQLESSLTSDSQDSEISTQSILRPDWISSGEGDDWVLVRYVGHPVGALVPLSPGELTIGRSRGNHLLLHDGEVSRRHARLEVPAIHEGGGRVTLMDAGSTNGTYLNGARLAPMVPAELHDGDLICIATHAFRLKRLDAMERRFHEAVLAQATRDVLTGLDNRGSVLTFLEGQGEIARRYHRPLSVCLLDLDHFKWINDRFGHAAGDRVLQHVGIFLLSRMRQSDRVGRIGGEEFLLVLPETSSSEAESVAASLREAMMLEEIELDGGSETLHVTLSAGVATLAPADQDVGALLARADASLYRAKSGGRNRVEVDARCHA